MAEWPSGEARVIIVKRLLPTWAAAQTWGRIIFIKGAYARSDKLISHEKIHIDQWKKRGFFFPFVYFWLMLKSAKKNGFKKAYHEHPYEVEARDKSGH
jgi:hypothetical protein